MIVQRQIVEEDRTVLLTIAKVWNLLNIVRAVGSGNAVQLLVQGGVTHKASKAALNKVGCWEATLLRSHAGKPLCSGHLRFDTR